MSEGGVTGRDERISEEMIEAACRASSGPWWDVTATERERAFKRDRMRDALAAALALLPDEAAIRTKIADEIRAFDWAEPWERTVAESIADAVDERPAARGSATEETR